MERGPSGEQAMAQEKARTQTAPKSATPAKSVRPIPEGYHTVTPYLIVDGAAKALEYYGKAFLAKTLFQMPGPGGKVMHAEMQIGDSRVMLADEFPEMGAKSPKTVGGTPVTRAPCVPDVAVAVERALKAAGPLKR